MANVLIVYGLLLGGLGFLVQSMSPTVGRVAFITGVAGGGLGLLWGMAALAGLKGRAWAVLSTIAALIVLLSQAVQAWTTTAGEGAGMLTVRLMVAAMFLLTIGMLLYLFHGERPPEFYQRSANQRENPFTKPTPGHTRDRRLPQ